MKFLSFSLGWCWSHQWVRKSSSLACKSLRRKVLTLSVPQKTPVKSPCPGLLWGGFSLLILSSCLKLVYSDHCFLLEVALVCEFLQTAHLPILSYIILWDTAAHNSFLESLCPYEVLNYLNLSCYLSVYSFFLNWPKDFWFCWSFQRTTFFILLTICAIFLVST